MRRIKVSWFAFFLASAGLLAAGVANATPIKVTPIAASASRSYPGTSPSYVFDGNTSTMWNAGVAPGVQPFPWVQIDLGRTVAVQKIRLLPAQTPSGNTVHSITAGQDPNSLNSVKSLSQYSYDNQWIEYTCDPYANCGNVRYIRITTSQSPSWVAWREIEIYQNIEYLGYFPFSNGDDYNNNYIPQTAGNGANMVMIQGDMSTWSSLMTQATKAGAKVALAPTGQLFDASFRLRSDWYTQWVSILQFIKNAPKNSIVAIYPLDEPYNHAADETELRTLAAQIHNDTYNQLGAALPVATIFAITEWWDFAASHISMFDWVGFDCYSPWSTGCRGHSIDAMLTQFKTKLSPNQRMIAVPWSFLYQPAGTDVATQYGVIDVINRWQRELMSDPRYIAVIPFLWQSGYIDGPSNPPANGTAVLSMVKERLYQFARSVLHQDSAIYPLDYRASATYSGSSPFFAFDRTTSTMWNAGGYPEAWILADFGGSTRVKTVTVVAAQTPAGQTTHILEGCVLEQNCSLDSGCTCSSWSSLASTQSSTQDGSTLSWQVNANVSRIRVRTTQDPSWVAWKDIRVSQ